jgi:phytoene synthase
MSLDQTLINDAAPPGSLRYFSLLYAPAKLRAHLAALYLIESEIRSSARLASHDVAHTRLQWWREEVGRLRNGSPQHPATRALATFESSLDFKALFDVLTAAEQDLAATSYEDEREVEAYLRRSGASTAELAASILVAPQPLSDQAREHAKHIGISIRRAEILRDLRQDAYDGRIYFALPTLARANIQVADLKQQALTQPVRTLVLEQAQQIRRDFDRSTATLRPPERTRLRPLLVLASLHARLLERIQREPDALPQRRVDLGPLEKVWISWRAAITAGRG